MARKLVKTTTGYAVVGGDFGGPEKVKTSKVKELGLDSGFSFLGTKTISELEYRALSKKLF